MKLCKLDREEYIKIARSCTVVEAVQLFAFYSYYKLVCDTIWKLNCFECSDTCSGVCILGFILIRPT